MSKASIKFRPADALPILVYIGAYWLDSNLKTISIYPIYLVPILWATSKWGLRAGVPLALLSAAISTPVPPLFEWGINATNLDMIFTRSTTLSLIAIFYSNYKKQVDSHRKRIDQLKSIVPQCPDCGAIFCNDGRWRPLEELIENPERIGIKPMHGCNASKQQTKP